MPIKSQFKRGTMDSKQLNSAFQMGIGFKSDKKFEALHHQLHLDSPLPGTGSASIFVSLSHENDASRADEKGFRVASVSTHVNDPENNIIANKEEVEEAVINKLASLGFLKKEDIGYMHSSTPKSWFKWTRREFGFVGGYPQYMHIKPWQMLGARLDGQKAYICGDTTYPGQGIPGAALSGIIAFEKLKRDHL
jgi:phytoene dehydrogenase-like protein